MLQTTDDKTWSTQAIENKKNQDLLASIGDASSGGVGRSVENLSTATKLAKFKKPKLTKPKKLDLIKA